MSNEREPQNSHTSTSITNQLDSIHITTQDKDKNSKFSNDLVDSAVSPILLHNSEDEEGDLDYKTNMLSPPPSLPLPISIQPNKNRSKRSVSVGSPINSSTAQVNNEGIEEEEANEDKSSKTRHNSNISRVNNKSLRRMKSRGYTSRNTSRIPKFMLEELDSDEDTVDVIGDDKRSASQPNFGNKKSSDVSKEDGSTNVRKDELGLKDFLWDTADYSERNVITSGIVYASIITRMDEKTAIKILQFLSIHELANFALVSRRCSNLVRQTFEHIQTVSFRISVFKDVFPLLKEKCPQMCDIVIDAKFASKMDLITVFDKASPILKSVQGSIPSGLISRIPASVLPRLTSLNQSVASSEDLLAIYNKCASELRELILFKSLRVDDVFGIESVLGACRKLHTLDIYGIRLNFAALINLRFMPHLRILRLQLAGLTNEECKVISEAAKNLEHLHLVENPEISSRGIKYIASKIKSLTELNIVSTGVRRDITKILSNERAFPKLRILRVSAHLCSLCEQVMQNRYEFCIVSS